MEEDLSRVSHSSFRVRHISSWMSTEAPKSSSEGKVVVVVASLVDAAEGVIG